MLIKKMIVTLTALTVINCYADKVKVSAIGHDIDLCKIDHHCDIKGSHDIEIINNSDKDHLYYYIYYACSIKNGLKTDCDKAQNKITVKAHSIWNNHYDSHSYPIFSTLSGHGYYIVATNVSGHQVENLENKYSIRIKN